MPKCNLNNADRIAERIIRHFSDERIRWKNEDSSAVSRQPDIVELYEYAILREIRRVKDHVFMPFLPRLQFPFNFSNYNVRLALPLGVKKTRKGYTYVIAIRPDSEKGWVLRNVSPKTEIRFWKRIKMRCILFSGPFASSGLLGIVDVGRSAPEGMRFYFLEKTGISPIVAAITPEEFYEAWTNGGRIVPKRSYILHNSTPAKSS